MADETPKEHNIMIGTLEKNPRDTVVVQIRTYRGRDYVDVRNHYTDAEGELKPTQKGINIEISRFKELKDLLDKVPAAIDDILKEEKKS
ncbi:MAG: transcriptional coactivator p15/PC4 family protein [Elusimicrobia bacterium]|nr:transcriptional coactivator p15/PC4 family protein [Candidatus Obscuribacterium magneticum]